MLHRSMGVLALACVLLACSIHQTSEPVFQPNTFERDVNILKKAFQPRILSLGEAAIAVVPRLQGRIMMATLSGQEGTSIGWLNRDALAQGETGHTGGGVDRLWYGPETGPFSVFVPKGMAANPDNIVLQDGMVNTGFIVESYRQDSLVMSQNIELINHAGFVFQAHIRREVSLLSGSSIEQFLGLPLPETVHSVAFQSDNRLTNMGGAEWSPESGLLSIWSLGMFEPSAHNTVVVPITGELAQGTMYFNQIKSSHTRVHDGVLYYRADSEYMNKTGVPMTNTLPVFGAYDTKRQRLTIIQFTMEDNDDALYVNSVWDWQAPPYQGEAINIFNDGPDDAGNYFGHFFELETSSAAIPLAPNETQRHIHRTFIFEGDPAEMNTIARTVLGVSLAQIESVFSD